MNKYLEEQNMNNGICLKLLQAKYYISIKIMNRLINNYILNLLIFFTLD